MLNVVHLDVVSYLDASMSFGTSPHPGLDGTE